MKLIRSHKNNFLVDLVKTTALNGSLSRVLTVRSKYVLMSVLYGLLTFPGIMFIGKEQGMN